MSAAVATVIKVGGALLGQSGSFELVTNSLTAFAHGRRAVVVPGGGPFADAVREMFRRIKISDDAAHWMAVLGMDQYAHALADRMTGAPLVTDRAEIDRALDAGKLPILAPYRWLHAADPLPHSWEVTSDSLSAWIAGSLGAKRLVLIKPVRDERASLVDGYFARALPKGVETMVLTPHELGRLSAALDESRPPGEWRLVSEG